MKKVLTYALMITCIVLLTTCAGVKGFAYPISVDGKKISNKAQLISESEIAFPAEEIATALGYTVERTDDEFVFIKGDANVKIDAKNSKAYSYEKESDIKAMVVKNQLYVSAPELSLLLAFEYNIDQKSVMISSNVALDKSDIAQHLVTVNETQIEVTPMDMGMGMFGLPAKDVGAALGLKVTKADDKVCVIEGENLKVTIDLEKSNIDKNGEIIETIVVLHEETLYVSITELADALDFDYLIENNVIAIKSVQ